MPSEIKPCWLGQHSRAARRSQQNSDCSAVAGSNPIPTLTATGDDQHVISLVLTESARNPSVDVTDQKPKALQLCTS